MARTGLFAAGWGCNCSPLSNRNRSTGRQRSLIPACGRREERRLVETPVALYACPSRGQRFSLPDGEGLKPAMGDYAGVVGEYFFEHDPAQPPRPAEARDTWRGIIAKGGTGRAPGGR